MRCLMADLAGSRFCGRPNARHVATWLARVGLLILLALVAVRASAQTFKNLVSFTGVGGAYPGSYPEGDLTLSGTSLFGMTSERIGGGDGTLFSVGTNGTGFQNLVSFSGGGAYPGSDATGSLTLSGTTLFGTTGFGGSGYGNLFSVGTNGSGFQNLLSFSGTSGAYPGDQPFAGLTLSGTTLYGATAFGGSGGYGNLFGVGVNGSGFQNLLTFTGSGGAFPGYNPDCSLTLSGTTLYGTTSQGGSGYMGNIFSVGTNGTGFQNLLSFTGTGGAYPGMDSEGTLTLSGTTLYGMACNGGSNGDGTVFSVGVNGSGFHNLLSFTGTGGAYPGASAAGSLTLIGSTFYGMTQAGGSAGKGTVFRVGANGSGFQSLLSFTGSGGRIPAPFPIPT